MKIIPDTFLFPFIKKEKINDAVSFYFDRSVCPDYVFLPGQYNRVFLPVKDDPQGSSRMFSVASSPLDKKHLMITTRISNSPFKKALNHLDKGTPVEFFGPIGRFLMDETGHRRHVFLAGGMGITPFYSMITYAVSKKITTPITLIASFSQKKRYLFFDELTELSGKNSNITIVYMSSLKSGKILGELIQKHIGEYQTSVFYICGSTAYVKNVEEVVLSLEVDVSQIRKEEFPLLI